MIIRCGRRRLPRLVLLLAVGVGAVLAPSVAYADVRFDDWSEESGVAWNSTRTWGFAWGDYDLDGFADLFVGRHSLAPLFFLNEKGEFKLAWDGDFYPGRIDRHGCAWGEANGDGRPDLYCQRGADWGHGAGPNQLLVQVPFGFVNRANKLDAEDPHGRGRTVNWLDYDLDNDLDLFLANARRAGYPNVLFRNDRGRFERVSVGVEDELQSIASSWADWDDDGDFDLLVNQYRKAPAVAYENLGGKFERTELRGITDRWWASASWGDYDGDGWTDVHLLNGGLSYVFHNVDGNFVPVYQDRTRRGRSSVWLDIENDGDLDLFVVQGRNRGKHGNKADYLLVNNAGVFTRDKNKALRGPRDGNGDAAATSDFDGDGRTDIYVTNGFTDANAPATLFRNRSDTGNWIALRLDGGEWNPWGMGAEVEVVSAAGIYRRQITDGVSWRAQSDVSKVVLGIGMSPLATVRVEWPDGEVDCALVEALKTLRVRKGSRGCAPL